MGTLETFKAPVENIPLSVAPMETLTPRVLPATEVATAELVSIETLQDEVAESEVNITTSAYTGKNCRILNLVHIFQYLLLNPKNFVEAPAEVGPIVMSEPEQEEEVTPPVIDLMMLGLIHQKVIQQ